MIDLTKTTLLIPAYIESPIVQMNTCSRCGEPKKTMKYNFCQKCKKLY